MKFCELRQCSFVPANTVGVSPHEKFRLEIDGTHRRFTSGGGENVSANSMTLLTSS